MRGLLLVLVVLAGCGGEEIAPAECTPGEARCFPDATVKYCDYGACPDAGTTRCVGWYRIQKCFGRGTNPPQCVSTPTAHCG